MDVVGLVAGTGFASGINLYATALLLGLLGRVLDTAAVPETLTSAPVLAVLGALTAIEFVADKVPWFDSLWDTVHTVVRPVGAAVLASLLLDGAPLLEDAIAAGVDPSPGDGDIGGVAGIILAVLLALTAHAAKSTTRVAVNTSPEPFSNSVVSLLEDGLVGLVVWLALEHPAVALGVVVVLTLVAVATVAALWRTVRGIRARMRQRSLRNRMRQVRR